MVCRFNLTNLAIRFEPVLSNELNCVLYTVSRRHTTHKLQYKVHNIDKKVDIYVQYMLRACYKSRAI